LGRDYRIDFRSGDLNLALHIRLGKNFPSERPEVHVEPPVLHPWVDPLGKVDSPGLREEGISAGIKKFPICNILSLKLVPCLSGKHERLNFVLTININYDLISLRFSCHESCVADPYVLGPPGSGCISTRFGSESGFIYHHAKIVRKALIPYVL
jgi:hypothetical protein